MSLRTSVVSKKESRVLSSCLPTNFGLDVAVAVLSSSSIILVSSECSFSFADSSSSFGFSVISSTILATPSSGLTVFSTC